MEITQSSHPSLSFDTITSLYLDQFQQKISAFAAARQQLLQDSYTSNCKPLLFSSPPTLQHQCTMLQGMPNGIPVPEFQLDEPFDYQNAVQGGVHGQADMVFGHQEEEGVDFQYQNYLNQPLNLREPSPPILPQQEALFHYPNPQYHQLQQPQHQNLFDNHFPFDIVPHFDFAYQDFHDEFPIWQQPADQADLPLYSQRNFSPSPSLFQSSDQEDEEMPYNQILHKCLKQQPDNKMELQDIYRWFMKTYPSKYTSREKGWQNSIRHNLSMNEAFEKATECDSEGSKMHFWQLSMAARAKGVVEPTTRYRNINDRRSKKRRSASPSHRQPSLKRRPTVKERYPAPPLRRNAPRTRRVPGHYKETSPEPEVFVGLPSPPPTGGETTDEEATGHTDTSRETSPAQPVHRHNLTTAMLQEYNGGLAQMFNQSGKPQLRGDTRDAHLAAEEMLRVWNYGHVEASRARANPNIFRQPAPMATVPIPQNQFELESHGMLHVWNDETPNLYEDRFEVNGGIYDEPFAGNHFDNSGNVDALPTFQPAAVLDNINLPVFQGSNDTLAGMIDPYLLDYEAPVSEFDAPGFGLERFGLGLGEDEDMY